MWYNLFNMIKNFIISLLAISIVFYLLPNINVVGDNYLQKAISVIIIGVLLSGVNILIKPIISLISLPINLLTLGLFSIIINALMIMIVDYISPSFQIVGFVNYIVFALLLSLVNIGLSVLKKF